MNGRYLTALTLTNFQSHAFTHLVFGPGLNVMVGPSDSGKTAILRALRWVLYNEPRGSDFVRQGEKECRVTARFSDGTLITRERSGSRNRYVLGQVDPATGEIVEQVFEGFGYDVPPQVLDAHGMPPVYLDEGRSVALNVASQLEGPFLLAESGGLRAKAIGRLYGVHVVDAAVRMTRKDQQAQSREANRLEADVDKLDAELAAFADLPAQEARLQQVAEYLAAADAASLRQERLQALAQRLASLDLETARWEQTLGALGGLAPAAEAAASAGERMAHMARLTRLQARHSALAAEHERTAQVLAGLGQLPAAQEAAGAAGEQLTSHARLTLLGQRTATLTAELGRLEQTVAALRELPGAETALTTVGASITRMARLRELQGHLGQLGGELHRLDATLAGVAQAEVAEQRASRLQALSAQLAELTRLQATLTDVETRLAEGHQYHRKTEQEIRVAVLQYEQGLKQLGKCPTCLSPIGSDSLAHIIREFGLGANAGEEETA